MAENQSKAVYVAEQVKEDFPILVNDAAQERRLVYLDSAASAQKPNAVIDAVEQFYRTTNANIHRGVYHLSVESTMAYDRARARVAQFIGAQNAKEVVFVRGATEGVNLVARSFLQPQLEAGDEILLTLMEHHANFVPWQLVAEETGALIKIVPVTPEGELDWEQGRKLLTERTRLFGFCQASNSLGTVNPAPQFIQEARAMGIPVLVDGAQSVVHGAVDVTALDCDFLVFSGHKLYGPTGIGVLYGKREHLESMRPYQGGGDMIDRVSVEGTTFAPPPERFEAGTPNIAGAIGLAAAVDYIDQFDREAMQRHEAALLEQATGMIEGMDGVTILGRASDKISVLSFLVEGVHSHDIATFLDVEGVAIRAGHHCCQPLMTHFGISGTNRASFGLYNTEADVGHFVEALHKTIQFFK